MSENKQLSDIGAINGIKQFIVVDNAGQVIKSRMEHTEKMAEMVFECGKLFFSIGKKNFTHAVFKRTCGNDFLIFPVGNQYIGMIKQKNIKTFTLIDSVKNFLADLT